MRPFEVVWIVQFLHTVMRKFSAIEGKMWQSLTWAGANKKALNSGFSLRLPLTPGRALWMPYSGYAWDEISSIFHK